MMRIRESKRVWVRGFVAAALLGSVAAHAGLVANGGFETGDFSGWTTSSLDPIFDSVYDGAPQAGTWAASFGNGSDANSVIGQTLSTTAGATYSVSFWLMNENDPNGVSAPNFFEFDWNGAKVMALPDAPAFGYTKYEFLLAATGTSTDLSFQFNQKAAFWDFDSVDAVVSSVPEPSSFAMAVVGGALALGIARRRRANRPDDAPAA